MLLASGDATTSQRIMLQAAVGDAPICVLPPYQSETSCFKQRSPMMRASKVYRWQGLIVGLVSNNNGGSNTSYRRAMVHGVPDTVMTNNKQSKIKPKRRNTKF
jgi:hypothetical protein